MINFFLVFFVVINFVVAIFATVVVVIIVIRQEVPLPNHSEPRGWYKQSESLTKKCLLGFVSFVSWISRILYFVYFIISVFGRVHMKSLRKKVTVKK